MNSECEVNYTLELDEAVIFPGADGATFTPHISNDGIISWTNDKGKENPEPVNIINGPIYNARVAAINEINNLSSTKLGDINTAGTNQLNNINSTSATQLNNINTAGTNQIDNINTNSTTQINNINETGANQIQAVIDKGIEVVESIKHDYPELSDDVHTLKAEVNALVLRNSTNILLTFGNFTNRTSGDTQWSWDDKRTTCTLSYNGVLSPDVPVLYDDKTELPALLIPNKTYQFKFSSTSSDLYLLLYFYVNGEMTSIDTITADKTITLPIDCSGLRLVINTPTTEFSGSITVELNNALTDVELNESINNLQTQIATKQDAPIIPGTTGQILALDEELHPIWLDQNKVRDIVAEKLLSDTIPGTIQTVMCDAYDNPITVTFSENNSIIRTDNFVWGMNTVTQTRTLSSGEYITMVTDLTTLATTTSDIYRGI